MQKTSGEIVDLDSLARERIATARRIVIKLGTRVLVASSGRPDKERMQALVREIAQLKKSGKEIVLVSSGAIGTGVDALGFARRPKNLPDLQMAAAVGQTLLMRHYAELFAKHNVIVGQVLLTHDDLKNRERHLNARNTLMNLLRHGVVPIINENDVVSVSEIKFGDNDVLGALTTLLVDADVLLLLSTTNGLRRPSDSGAGKTERVPFIAGVTDDVRSYLYGKGSELSTGGMESKLEAAEMVGWAGAVAVIADGRDPSVIGRVCNGEDVGTRVLSQKNGCVNSKKRWIAFFHKSKGVIVIDDGAKAALVNKGHSLLPIGVRRVDGDFIAGAVVSIKDGQGELIAKGVVSYSSEDIRRIKGRRSSELAGIVGSHLYEEVVHRDNMVVL